MSMRDLDRERYRRQAIRPSDPPPAPTGAPAFVGRVYSGGAIPTALGKFYLVHRVSVLGTEVEGGAGSLVVDSSKSYAVDVIGSKAPVAGEDLVCRFVGDRWVAERFGAAGATGTIPGCPCATIPATLFMHVTNPTTNSGIFQPATLQYYSPPPSAFSSLALGSSAYLSTTSFSDDSSADQFWYYFTCLQGFYVLTRVYITSIFGSPYRDSVRYRWLVGFPGNTCTPFSLHNGTIFTGGDATCVVSIDTTGPP